MSLLRHLNVPSLCVLAGLAACDNVGRAFDRDVNPGGGDPTTGVSAVEEVPIGGDVRDGRPRVRAAYPEGAGWPVTVPIVVEFSESVNSASLLPTTATGIDGRIGVRVQGTQQFLPCQYSLLAGGRFLVMRPLNALSNNNQPVYEIVLLADSRDVDGVRFQVTGGETVLSDFQVNQDEEIVDGRILAIYPRDNFSELAREADVLVVFDRPANPATLIETNVFLRPSGGTQIAAQLGVPLSTVGVEDPRVLRIDPAVPLSPSQRYELVVTEDITFGQEGRLEFNGRTPFARFDTVAPAAPQKVELGNAATGFPNQINVDNALSVMLRVTTPDDAEPGDVVRARIYGGDADTPQTFDKRFVERTATVPGSGEQGVLVDFSGDLGTILGPRFDDGGLTFAAQMQRGSRTSGFIRNEANEPPTFDITAPTLTQIGPPTAPNGTDILTDQEYVCFFGVASERLSEVELADTVNSLPAELFASGTSGRTFLQPLALGRLTAPRGYSLSLVDRAGNLATGGMGNIVQRGVVTGTLAGTLTVEVYDDTTMLPIQGAQVVVDPGVPALPASGQARLATDATGRAVFSTAAGSHTITIVHPGFDLLTLYDTQAAFVSLPLRPTVAADSVLRGTVELAPTPGTTAIVGSSGFSDRSLIAVRTTSGSPTQIPTTPVRANRPQVFTAFGGVLEPTATPTFAFHGCQILGDNLLTPTPPPLPVGAGAELAPTIRLVEATGGISALSGTRTIDFTTAVGLDLNNLVSLPRVRVTASLRGLGGQVLAGLGFAVDGTGGSFVLDANYSASIVAGFVAFTPTYWLLVEAQDTAGRLSRTRDFLLVDTGNLILGIGPSAIPTVTSPGGPVTGAPAVQHVDVLDATLVPGGIALHEFTATDAAGRRWLVLAADRDAVGGTDSVQFPDLSQVPVAGLAAGSWSVLAEARLLQSGTLSTVDDFVLAERSRAEVNLARAVPVTFTVQ